MASYMSGALQENILTLLCFDKEASSIVRGTISPESFDSSVYQDIAKRAVAYLDSYKDVPGKHLPDLFEDILEGKDAKKASIYERVLDQLLDFQDGINTEYVINQLTDFSRKQNLKTVVTDAVKLIKDDNIDEAELVLSEGLSRGLVTFQPGTFFWDSSQVLKFLDDEENSIHMGIECLDRLGICPAPKELFTVIAPAGRGKTWMMIHIAKHALLQRKRVVHITLEMSEAKMAGRYTQALFSITKRQVEVKRPFFEYDETDRLSSIGFDTIADRPTLQDDNIEDFIAKKINSFTKIPLVIRQFPTSSLTIHGLEAYLDSLERFEKFVPDILVLDYADLMKIDTSNLRLDTGRIYKQLRGLAVSRNIAVVTASQTNRQGEDARIITKKHLAEDYSKAAISDNMITYNQTSAEKALNLARLFVAKGRNDKDGQTVLISQAYEMGQFCTESTLMLGSKYWNEVDALSEQDMHEGKRRRASSGSEEDEGKRFD